MKKPVDKGVQIMFEQKLFKRRLTDAPLSIAQAQCNCGLFLNGSKRVKSGEIGLKTLDNNSDAHLTLERGGKTSC